jgi:DNA-binding LytR/AlgR family response regulator
MIPIRVLVCDDEAIARKRAVRIASELLSEAQVEGCSSGKEALARLEEQDFDVLLLDVDMPGMSGIEVARQLPEPAPYVVFLTAHPEHAVSAFDVGATDYLVKPLEEDRLRKALERVSKRLHEIEHKERPAQAQALNEGKRPQKLAIQERGGVVLLDPEKIFACVLGDSLVTVSTQEHEVLSTLTLSELHSKLPHLERVHRKALLNMDLVERLESLPSGGYSVRLPSALTEHSVEISRQAARVLRKRFGLT